MTDLKIDETGDLAMQSGDLVSTESTLQHQADIIWSEKSWWHFSPLLGVGLQRFINEVGTSPGLVRVIRQELERDGATIETISITQDGINVEAFY
jgi:hypothetical protein